MEWIFIIVILLVTVFLCSQYRAFRRYLLFTVVGAVALGAIGGVLIYLDYLNGQRYEQEQQRLMTLIKASDLKLDELTLSHSNYSISRYWDLRGNVTNLSNYRLKEFTLHIKVYNCPDGNSCVVVGDKDTMVGPIDVPPSQMRTFSESVSLENMPELKGWKWFYDVKDIKAN